jgi:hypothetical protein
VNWDSTLTCSKTTCNSSNYWLFKELELESNLIGEKFELESIGVLY